MNKATTLIELVIAIALMAVVVLGAVVFDVSSHKFFSSSERKTAVLNDMALVLDNLHKDVTLAYGPTIVVAPSGPPTVNNAVFFDPNSDICNHLGDPDDPEDPDFDYYAPSIGIIQQRVDAPAGPTVVGQKNYEFWSNPGVPECAAGGVAGAAAAGYSNSVGVDDMFPVTSGGIGFTLLTQRLVSVSGITITNGCLRIGSIVMRYNPSLPADNSTNPEVKSENIVFCPRQSSF